MALQGAAYSGYVDVNWNKTTKDLKSVSVQPRRPIPPLFSATSSPCEGMYHRARLSHPATAAIPFCRLHRVLTTLYSQLLDVDGNGEFDSNDAKIILMKFIEICTFNLPSGAGFSGGLALGTSPPPPPSPALP